MFCAGSTGTEGRPRCGSQASATSTLNTRGSILTRSYRCSNGKLMDSLKSENCILKSLMYHTCEKI